MRQPAASAHAGAAGVLEPAADPLEQILPELSTALLSATVNDVDTEIGRSLERCAIVLGADRVSVIQMAPDEQNAHETHSHARSAVPAFPVIIAAGEFPWLSQQLRLRRIVRLPNLPKGLPVHARPERALIARAGVKSLVLVPFATGDSAIGAMALSSVRTRQAWPERVTTSVGLLAQAIGNALARRRALFALEERVSFQRLVADLVATLLGAPSDELDARIRRGLARITGHFGIDRCSVARIAPDGMSASVTHAAAAPGISRLDSPEELGWVVARKASSAAAEPAREAVCPEGSALARQSPRGTGMHLSIPLSTAGRLWGAIEFSALTRPRRWTEGEVQRLALVGGILMEALVAREAEQRAQEQRAELAHVARVAALGELTAALAHELNQPLMAIRANAQATRRMLREGRAPAMEEVLVDIAQDATRAGDLIARLRDLLRRRQVAKEPLDVEEMLAGVRAIARAEAQRCGAQLVVEAGGALPRVLGDAIQLQQVVLNLVRNAAEAMSGHVEGGAVRIRTWATGEQVMLAVEDEGPPIDEVALREMFTPFSTTKAEGLGIGLAISRSIVEAHGGRLWAERRPGAGLAVQFTLPAWVSKWTTVPPASDLQERG